MADNWNLLGHEWAVDMLRQHAAHDEIRHAYLFCGPPGLGRRTLALRLAQALNCTKPLAPGVPCGLCRDCKQIEAMQHPDMNVIQALDGDNQPKEGGTLKVDQIREVQRSLSLKPYQSKYRVALFLRFQEANDNAANALLKTLEEAPAHAILVLTADTPSSFSPPSTHAVKFCACARCPSKRLLPISSIAAWMKNAHACSPTSPADVPATRAVWWMM